MKLFARMLVNTFKVSASYRLNYLINLLFSFFFNVMTVSVWQALYKNDDGQSSTAWL